MESEWFYTAGGSKHGPVTTKGLVKEVGHGNVIRSDLVWSAGFTEWTEASQLEWLFPLSSSDDSERNIPLSRLWHGEMSLVATFWFFGVVLGSVTLFALAFLGRILPILFGGLESMPGIFAQGACGLAMWATATFLSVSIWRSAGKSSAPKVWRVLARASVVPLIAYIIFSFIVTALIIAAGI